MTNDVTDCCAVAGVPAREVNEKCNRDDARNMNSIAWWNWSDEIIKNRMDDFRLSILEFVAKYQIGMEK